MIKQGKRCLSAREQRERFGPGLLSRAAAMLLTFCMLISLIPMTLPALAEGEPEGVFPGSVEYKEVKLYRGGKDEDGNDYSVTNVPTEDRLLQSGDKVSKADSFFYYIVLNVMNFSDVRNKSYSIPAPTGLFWPEGNGASVDLTVDVSGEGIVSSTQKIGTLTIGADSTVMLAFAWSDETQAAFDAAEIDGAELKLGINNLTLGKPEDVEEERVTIKLIGGTECTLTITENMPKPYNLVWDGTGAEKNEFAYDEKTGSFTWKLNYIPGKAGGSISKPESIKITLDSDYDVKQIYTNGFTLKNADTSVTVDSTQYTAEVVDGVLVITPTELGSTLLDQSLTITFNTVPTDAVIQERAEVIVHNSAAFGYGEGQPDGYSISALGKIPAVKWITKTNSEFLKDNKAIKWTVTVYTHNRNLRDLTLYDYFDSTVLKNPNAVTVTDDQGGNIAVTPDLVGGTVGDAPNVKSYSLKIGFPDSRVSSFYTVTYVTPINEDQFGKETEKLDITNSAWLDFKWWPYGGGDGEIAKPEGGLSADKTATVVRNFIESKQGTYNPANHTITWAVTVNPHKVNITGGTFTDTLPKGLSYVEGSLSGPSVDFQSKTKVGENETLTFKLENIGTTTVVFTFDTVLDASESGHFGYNDLVKKYTNTIKLIATIGGVTDPISVQASGWVDTKSTVLKKEAMSYDVDTHELQWKITLNQNGMPMPDAILTDVLPEGMTLFPEADGDLVKVTDATLDAVAYENGTLTVTLSDVKKDATVTFTTRIDPDVLDQRTPATAQTPAAWAPDGTADFLQFGEVLVGNDVTLTRSGYDNLKVHAEKKVDNHVLAKTGKLSDNKAAIRYTIKINANQINLSGLKNVAVVDTLAEGTRLNADSVKLYQATVNSAGVFAKGELLPVGAYTFSYNPVNRNFTLHLPEGRGRAFILDYSVDIVDFSKKSFKNSVSFTGELHENLGSNTDTEFGANASAAAEAMRRLRGGLQLTVTDKVSGKPVKGLRYTLSNERGNPIDAATTNEFGVVKFISLPINKSYMLVLDDSTLPEGYFVPPALAAIKVDKVLGDEENGLVEIDAELDRITVALTFTKVSELGYNLPGVKFTLTSKELKKDGNPIYTAEATTGKDGKLSFAGIYCVMKDGYTLTETPETVPAGHEGLTLTGKPKKTSGSGHLPNEVAFIFDPVGTTPANANVSGTGASGIKVTDPVVKTNGSVNVYKYDSDTSAPMVGVVFTLYQNGAQVGESKSTDANGIVVFDGLSYGVEYVLRETTPSGYTQVEDKRFTLTNEDGKRSIALNWPNSRYYDPGPPVSPPSTPTPTPTPTPPPTPPPTSTPTPTPSPEPSASPRPTPPVPPDVRPTPPPLTTEEKDKVDEVIKDVTEHPEHIIKDRDGFEERFPDVSIEDLPTPLYWGPEFAIVEVPIYEELIAIDSDLIPLGALPQTGMVSTHSGGLVWVFATGIGGAALGGLCLLDLRRKRRTGK